MATRASGGHLVSSPAPISTGTTASATSFTVLGRPDNALWSNGCTVTSTGISCGGWTSLGGVLTSKPGAAFDLATGTYSVYARGTDGAVWGLDHTSAGWGSWYTTGGALLPGTGPSAAYLGANYVLVAGTNHQLYIQQVGQGGFTAVGGATDSSPARAATPAHWWASHAAPTTPAGTTSSPPAHRGGTPSAETHLGIRRVQRPQPGIRLRAGHRQPGLAEPGPDAGRLDPGDRLVMG